MKVHFGLKDYQSACHYAEQALSKTDAEDWDNLQDVYGHLIMIHALLGNVSQSAVYLKKYNEMTAKLSDKNLHSSLQEMEVKYDVQQKQFEIERQQTEIERHRTRQFIFTGSLFAAGLLLAMLAIIVVLRTRRNRALAERNSALAEMNAIKDKFFSIISHDLKNPAVAQRDSLQMLSENVTQLDTNKLSLYLRNSLKLANGLVDMLTNLLNWAKIQTGRESYNPSTFNLIAALQPDIDVVKSMAERKTITFEAMTPPTLLITCDKNMLITVVRNLLTNAVKFTETGGKVTLDISPGRDAARHVSTYTFTVTDTGVGMTQEQMQNLFRIDRQQTREGTAGEHSSGLGLIVCRDLLQKHGSTLNIESEIGIGSRFWFEVNN